MRLVFSELWILSQRLVQSPIVGVRVLPPNFAEPLVPLYDFVSRLPKPKSKFHINTTVEEVFTAEKGNRTKWKPVLHNS